MLTALLLLIVLFVIVAFCIEDEDPFDPFDDPSHGAYT